MTQDVGELFAEEFEPDSSTTGVALAEVETIDNAGAGTQDPEALEVDDDA